MALKYEISVRRTAVDPARVRKTHQHTFHRQCHGPRSAAVPRLSEHILRASFTTLPGPPSLPLRIVSELGCSRSQTHKWLLSSWPRSLQRSTTKWDKYQGYPWLMRPQKMVVCVQRWPSKQLKRIGTISKSRGDSHITRLSQSSNLSSQRPLSSVYSSGECDQGIVFVVPRCLRKVPVPLSPLNHCLESTGRKPLNARCNRYEANVSDVEV